MNHSRVPKSPRFPPNETFLTQETIELCNETSQEVPKPNISMVFDNEKVNKTQATKLVHQHNESRVPIYIAGDVRNKDYKGLPVMPAFHSTDNKPLDIQPYKNMVDNEVTYSVWGNCKAKKNTEDAELIDFVSIHAWGVNFESSDAVDTRLILNHQKTDTYKIISHNTKKTFYHMCKRMWTSIIQAGIDSQIHAKSSSDYDSSLIILTPAIGCGAYLNYLVSTYDNLNTNNAETRKSFGDRYWDNPTTGLTTEELDTFEKLHRLTYSFQYMQFIFKALNDSVLAKQEEMTIYNIIVRAVLQTKERNTCMAFENNVRESNLIKRAMNNEGSTLDNLFTPLHCNDVSNDNVNIFPKVRLGVVNAWDTFSWIGNGGSRDMSVDGFYVAGWLAGKTFVNNSYLLNSMYTNNFL